MHSVVLICASILLGVAGQLLLKAGMSSMGPLSLEQDGAWAVARRIGANLHVWSGLALYGIGTFFWLVALSQVDLSYAYPFLILSYVLILLASWVVFREALTWWRMIGVAAVCAGVCIVAAG